MSTIKVRSEYVESIWNQVPFITKNWCSDLIYPQSVLVSHRNTVQVVEFNPTKSSELYSGGHDKVLKKWDLNRQQCVDTFSYKEQSSNFHKFIFSGGVWGVEFSKSGNYFYACQSNGQVCLWDPKSSKKPQNQFHAGYDKVFQCSLSKDEKYLSCVGVNYNIDIYDTKSMKKFKSIPSDAILTYNAKFFGDYMITSDILGKLVIYDNKNFNVVTKQENYVKVNDDDEQKLVGLAIDDQNRIYCGYSQGNVRVYKFENQQLTLQNEFLAHMSGIKSMAVNSNDNILATGAKDGSGRLWNTENNQFIKSLSGHRDNCCSIAFCPGQRQLATGAWDQKVILFKY